MRSSVFFVACLAIVAYGTPVARNMQVHETRAKVPEVFKMTGPASPETMLDLRIALVSSDMAGLEKALMDVSTPGSPLRGQFLTKEEVRRDPLLSAPASSEILTSFRIHRSRPS